VRLLALLSGFTASVDASTGQTDKAIVYAILAVAAALLSLRSSKFADRVRDEIELYDSRRADED
jgi:hypothetical protein